MVFFSIFFYFPSYRWWQILSTNNIKIPSPVRAQFKQKYIKKSFTFFFSYEYTHKYYTMTKPKCTHWNLQLHNWFDFLLVGNARAHARQRWFLSIKCTNLLLCTYAAFIFLMWCFFSTFKFSNSLKMISYIFREFTCRRRRAYRVFIGTAHIVQTSHTHIYLHMSA